MKKLEPNAMDSEPKMTGRIHSFESTSFVDGPGARCVVFFQGCPLRCIYCHNPDTWDMGGGTDVTAAELVERVKRFTPYFARNGGGLTCSGGEPLYQPEFLLEVLTLAKGAGIHTALDTSGFGRGMYDEILAVTDLVLLDIKQLDQQGFKDMCAASSIQPLLEFEEALNRSSAKVWIRHVVIPGVTDSAGHLGRIHQKARSFRNLEKIELLPYHTLGEMKYRCLGIDYPLDGLGSMDRKAIVDPGE